MCKKPGKYKRKNLIQRGPGKMVSFNVVKTAKPTRPKRTPRRVVKDGLLIVERFKDVVIQYDYTQDKHLSGARVRMI